jgi:hypothetical protein
MPESYVEAEYGALPAPTDCGATYTHASERRGRGRQLVTLAEIAA